MKKIIIKIIFMFIFLISLNHYVIYINENEIPVDKELNFMFSMKDIEAFNYLVQIENINKNISFKVDLLTDNRNQTIKIKNINDYIKDSILTDDIAFTMETSKSDKLYDRQIYDVISIKNNDYSFYTHLNYLAKDLNIYFPFTNKVNIKINRAKYGSFIIKQAYDDIFLSENKLENSVLFKIIDNNKNLDIDYITDSIDRDTKLEIESFIYSLYKYDYDLIKQYFNMDYIAKLKALAVYMNLEEDFFTSYNTIYIYNKNDKKVYPIVDEQFFSDNKISFLENFLNKSNYSNDLDAKRDYYFNRINEQSNDYLVDSNNFSYAANEDESNVLQSIKIGNTKGKIDYENKVIFVSLEKGSDTTQQISYKFSKNDTFIYLESSPNKLNENILGKKILKINNNQKYNFNEFIYNGKLSYFESNKKITYELYITTGEIPLIEINTIDDKGIVKEIDISEKIPCKIRIISNHNSNYNNKTIESRIEISGKEINEKKNYSVVLDKDYQIEGMIPSRKWILDGTSSDISSMRKKITFDFLSQIYSEDDIKIRLPDIEFVEVILNGKYQGLYTLGNKIDSDLLELDDFDEYDKSSAYIYKSVNENANFSKENTNQNLYKKEYKNFPDKMQPKYKMKDPIYGWHSGYEQKWPDEDTYGEYWEQLENLISFIVQSSDKEFNEEIFDFINKEMFIDLWILLQIENNINGTVNSQYVVKSKEDGKWFFIPNNSQFTFGRDNEMDKVKYYTWTTNYLFERCMKIDEFKNDYKDKWNELIDKSIITKDNYNKSIQKNMDKITDAIKRNEKIWDTYEETNFYDEIEYMKEWLEKRIYWLNNHINQRI